ncbi:uncharacterized protein LOC123672838 isoform X2 [Harmonia axyridis]|uniref:uncharacterized protein LOC123672838 isoform X2 n=1 Tax=Harmonia axyridis TaxID=115357 RepID=UPI001E276864|nr:uncharacterized protein LOC123672838 isoform X2 [Harmonia axyridis]
MEICEDVNSEGQSGKELPRVPIKTYKWEDVRRSRRKGGYPWTYLYKEEFDESVHPEDFRMDGLKKNKTSSASSASDSLDIREITEDDVKGLEGIDSSYVVIESPILLGGQRGEPIKDREAIIESADSSDSISQYLDKEERGPEQRLESTETLTHHGPEDEQRAQIERAKSEEPKRKRKLSVESNYSRISLSRLGMMKRLREAKDKIKLPKFSSKQKKEMESETIEKVAPIEQPHKHSKNEKPVYIHIPLKPPEGETDEFSHLEFEEKLPQKPPPVPEVQIEVTEDVEPVKIEENIPEIEETDDQSNGNNLGLIPPNDQEDDVSAIIFLEGEEGCDSKGEYDIIAVDIDENSQEMKMSQITNTEVRRQVLESIKKVESQSDIAGNKEGSGVSLSRSSSKASKTSKASIRKRRAKSVEPEKKRRGSIDSSYSRKSLSRIGLLKKLKKIHIPFVKSQSKKSIAETSSAKIEVETEKETPKPQTQGKDQKPVYIHIPLKPPEGTTDEFSHLEFNTAPPPQTKVETNETNETEQADMSPIDSPETSKAPQFIVLTPPSDDEILDRPDIPETPSSETGSLFQFGELQHLAKKAVDQILESVNEETDQKPEQDTVVVEETLQAPLDGKVEEKVDIPNTEKVTIDEEDGLKSVPSEEIKSNLKTKMKGESSPLPKKKVSFKRRKSSQVSQELKDDGYEEIESPATTAAAISGGSVGPADSAIDVSVESMNTLDVEPDLSRNKLVESTSFEEDHNRWSKISDHEYEPINPPPEEKTETSPPKSHVSDVLNPPSIHTDDELDVSAQAELFFNRRNSPSNLGASRGADLRSSPSRSPSRSRSKEKEPAKPGKFQTAIKESATKFKTKLQGIKKPTISLPSRPKFQKPNFKKPNINLPKLPDISSTFRRNSKAEEGKSAETKDMDVKTAEGSGSKGIFDFSTYPRIFKKKKREHDSSSLKGDDMERPEKKTWQVRSKETADIIRIPLHSEESMDQENGIYPQPEEILEVGQIEIDHRSSPPRYQEDIEADDEDAFQRERQEKHREAIAAAAEPEESRWDHGNFYRSQNGEVEEQNDREEEEDLQREEVRDEEYIFEAYEKEKMEPEMVTDLDAPETPFVPNRQNRGRLQQTDSFDTNHSRDVGSSVSSLGQHRRGVLEEIDSDQFFLREKGISQDNIDMGKYLSTEIREAFRSPTNALADIHTYNYEEIRASNQSLPETKKKQVKKPKRRKTPHASQERLRYEPESENEDYNFMPPIRPKRKSKRRRRAEPEPVPFVETIPLDSAEGAEYSPEQEEEILRHYENERMRGIEHPNIRVSEPYSPHRLQVIDHHDAHRRASEPIPAAPPRKHKSLKSLNASEHESIFEEYDRNDDKHTMNGYANEDVFLSSDIGHNQDPNQVETPRPPKPPTRSRSKTRSMSRTTSQADRDSILGRMDSIMFDEEFREPVVEEPCVKDLRDSMGYAIVDKNQNKNWEHKFCTVPRSQGSKDPPERPLRNYSTLGPSRPVRKPSRNMTDEEKENVDVSQYIEIEDDRDLQSGEVIQKIQNRPLPAPPRPPRSRSKPLGDITSRSNLEMERAGDVKDEKTEIDETEVSTQTEPLPSDFECEEMIHEETDKIMTPSALRKNELQKITDETDEHPTIIERVFITPTQYSYQEETITHGQLLVEPLNGARILPDSDMSHERIIPITSDEDEFSEIPENFNNLRNPNIQTEMNVVVKEDINVPEEHLQKENSSDQKAQSSDEANTAAFDMETIASDEKEPQRPPRSSSLRAESVDVLKTQKLQVSDLDVDRLTVNELVANKIVVSEIESGSISSHDISSKSGTLRLADLELQPDIVRKLLEQLKESSRQQPSIIEEENPEVDANGTNVEEKKTPIDFHVLETSESQDSSITLVPSTENENEQTLIVNSKMEENLPTEEAPEEFVPSTSVVCDANVVEYVDDIVHEASATVNAIKSVESEDVKIEDEKHILNIEPVVGESITLEEDISKVEEEVSVDGMAKEETEMFESIVPNSENSVTIQDELKDEEVSNLHENVDEESINEEPPLRPPRSTEKKMSVCEQSEQLETPNDQNDEMVPNVLQPLQLLEPEVDDEPPPRPPQPQVPYIPSQPPAAFYALRAQHYVEDLPDDIPMVPRRKRHHRPTTISKSSSSESTSAPLPRRRVRSPEPSIPQLTGQLAVACSTVARNRLKRLIDEVTSKISSDPDSDTNRQNVQVLVVVLLVFIAGLLLLGYGDGRTVHTHHWEYFNPPTDI